MATSVKEIRKASRRGQLASLLGVEGGHMIEDDMSKLIEFHKGGVRYMTLTWNNSTSWATSALDETSPNPSEGGASAVQRKKGLTEFGKEVVRMMNQLGMLVDLSHVGEQCQRRFVLSSCQNLGQHFLGPVMGDQVSFSLC